MSTAHIYSVFDDELKHLARRIAEMGGMAEQMVSDSIHALVTSDSALAQRVISEDAIMDATEREINTWLTASKAKVVHIFGNVAPQTPRVDGNTAHLLGAERTSARGFVASDIFIAVVGPDTPATGEAQDVPEAHQGDVAATILQHLGLDWRKFHADARPPLPLSYAPH